MYTHCPHCRTTFRIHVEQLAQARGQVRCGVCNDCFNALDALSDYVTAPAPPAAEAPAAELPPPAPPLQQPVVEAGASEEAAAALEVADSIGGLAETADGAQVLPVPAAAAAEEILPDLGIIAAEPRALPAGAETRPAPLWQTSLWAALNILLILVLVGQYVYYNRQQLAQYPELRPWLAQACASIGCDIPLQRDVKRIALTERLVESHPSRANALLIDATLVNQADFTQPFPLLELRFSDLNNQLIAGRRFHPDEYLQPATPWQAGMAPHQPVHITLEIVDPGKDAVSFQFDLL